MLLSRSITYSVYCVFRRYVSKTVQSKKSKLYSKSINLPQTKFALSLRDGVAADREKEIQRLCGFTSLYQWQRENNTGSEFVLHDGPPYANGVPHVGHALNKILKDITNRYRLLRGHRVHYVPGWDCHGLPIELQALGQHQKSGTDVAPLEIRRKARKFAENAIESQKAAFKRWGVMADWNNCYHTFDKEFEAKQIEVFYKMFQKGLIYRGYMPVYWSPSSRTALAESELEYNEQHVSTAVYVRFPMRELLPHLNDHAGSSTKGKSYLVIWTTTPWTLPANRAICYGPNMTYSIVKCLKSGDTYICAEKFVDHLKDILDSELQKLKDIMGSELQGSEYWNMFVADEALPVLPGDHVTPDKGTGLVHTAPAHGRDDFNIALKHKVPIRCHVTEDGVYDGDSGVLAGKKVMGDADTTVIDLLGDDVLLSEKVTHSYPYDWRTKLPVIIRSSKQWFVDTSKLKTRALECLSEVHILPQSSEQSLIRMLETRPYWCISRQRVWGVPIPVFYRKDNDDTIFNDAVFQHVQKLVREHGSDCWWSLPVDQLLSEEALKQAGINSASDCKKGSDILDIWFDSGTTWASVLGDLGKADVYLEGRDQFGAWFQTSLLTSIALQDTAPYRNLIVHGFTVDEDGFKMSKSVGNVIDPYLVTDGSKSGSEKTAFGADVMRLWVASSMQHTNVSIGNTVLKDCQEIVFKIRKSLRFLLGNIYDFDPVKDAIDYNRMTAQDKYMLHLLHEFNAKALSNYDEFNYPYVIRDLEKFINVHVSGFYSTGVKDRCYCESSAGRLRRSSQTVQYHLLQVITLMMAPILPHLAEEVFQHFPGNKNNNASNAPGIFRSLKLEEPWSGWKNDLNASLVKFVLHMRERINSVIVSENPNDFEVVICGSRTMLQTLRSMQKKETSCHSGLTDLLQTSRVTLLAQPPITIPDDCHLIQGSCQLRVSDDDPGQFIPYLDDIDDVVQCSYQQSIYEHEAQEEKERYTLMILPAQCQLCERCRRYTAQSHEQLCERCNSVMETLEAPVQ